MMNILLSVLVCANNVPHYIEKWVKEVPKDRYEKYALIQEIYKSASLENFPLSFYYEDFSEKVERKIFGKDVKLIFHGYKRIGDKYCVYTNLGVEEISKEEFNKVVEDNIKYIETAVSDLYSEIKDVEKLTVNKLQEKIGDKLKNKDLYKILNDEIDGIKIKEMLLIPEIRIEDILPKEYHFSPISALGATYLESGIVSINPIARIADYIIGEPLILKHELIHNITSIQNIPLCLLEDVELLACIGNIFTAKNTNPIDFSLHQYLISVQDLSKILFNFDTQKWFYYSAFPLETGLKVNRDKFEEFMNNVDVIKDIFKDIIINDYLPEFFSNPLYWGSINVMGFNGSVIKFIDIAFRAYMFDRFDPMEMENFKEFVSKNFHIIKNIAELSYSEMKNNSILIDAAVIDMCDELGFNEKETDIIRAMTYRYIFSNKEMRGNSFQYLGIDIDNIIKTSKKTIDYIRKFLGKEGKYSFIYKEFVKTLNIKENLEKEERIWEWILKRVEKLKLKSDLERAVYGKTRSKIDFSKLSYILLPTSYLNKRIVDINKEPLKIFYNDDGNVIGIAYKTIDNKYVIAIEEDKKGSPDFGEFDKLVFVNNIKSFKIDEELKKKATEKENEDGNWKDILICEADSSKILKFEINEDGWNNLIDKNVRIGDFLIYIGVKDSTPIVVKMYKNKFNTYEFYRIREDILKNAISIGIKTWEKDMFGFFGSKEKEIEEIRDSDTLIINPKKDNLLFIVKSLENGKLIKRRYSMNSIIEHSPFGIHFDKNEERWIIIDSDLDGIFEKLIKLKDYDISPLSELFY